MSTTTTTPIGQLLQAIFNVAKNDLIKDALPALNKFFQSVAATPGTLNLAVQLAALQVDLLAAIPKLESDVVKDISVLIQADLQTLTASAAS